MDWFPEWDESYQFNEPLKSISEQKPRKSMETNEGGLIQEMQNLTGETTETSIARGADEGYM